MRSRAWRSGQNHVVTVLTLVAAALAVSVSLESQVPVVRTGDPAKRGLTAKDFPRVQQLAPNVYSYEQLRSAGTETFTTVSLFVVTPAGVLVADGQGSLEETRRMVQTIAGITPRPITHVVVCSDHGDHTAGNAAFPSAATVYAHPTSRGVMAAAFGRGQGRGGTPPAPVPTVDVADKTVVTLGGTEIQLLFLGRAHTGGDLHVYLPREGILFMSEAYLNRIFPAMRSAYPREWAATIARAQALGAKIYVPGHGFVESPAILAEELETFRRAVLQVIDVGAALHRAKVPVDQAVAQAAFGDLDTWTLRSSQASIAIRRVYAELDGTLK